MKTTSTSNSQVKIILVFLLAVLVYPGMSQIYLVKDINDVAGQSGGPIGGFIQRGNLLYFIANDGVHGQELWRTNGSSTYMVKDINPGMAHGLTSPPRMAVCYGKLFFLANDGQHGVELWSTFQSTAIMVEDLRPGNNTNHIFHLTVVNNILLFQASPIIGNLEWWKANADNTAEIVKDIRPGALGAQLGQPSVGLGLVFFGADDGGVIGEQLWITNGTEAGTKPIANRRVGIGQGVEYNNSVYLMLEEPLDGFELFRANASGAVMVKNINTQEFGSSQPKATDFHGMVYKGNLYFNAFEPSHGDALWKTDGTPQGTFMVKDIYPGSQSDKGYIGVMKVFKDFLYFTADDGTPGLDLWRTDGTESGTIKVKDFAGGIIGNYHQLGEKLYFIGNDGIHGNELWETDGTEEGTKMVQDFYPGPSHGVYLITVFEDKIFLGASDGTIGYELYAYSPFDCNGPIITEQPSGGTFNEGANITLSVDATGDGLSYQWQKYYEDIPGAISKTFTILNINPSNAGEYTCRVKNSCTTVTSDEASVKIGEPTNLDIIGYDKNNTFTISPNPANQWVQIARKDSNISPETFLSVFNTQGILLLKSKFNNRHNIIDIAGLPPGLYIVLIQTSGVSSTLLKFTIQR